MNKYIHEKYHYRGYAMRPKNLQRKELLPTLTHSAEDHVAILGSH